ncbi:MAG: hypothetical protein PHI31_02175 [Desulfuromonadaceae bacterium]|nr:hypothetical protein [Desulfuromonadaceae bacterium]
MASAVHSSYRPAGIRFETVAAPQKETLPRMDVAVFVGFAAKGHVHEPCLIESVLEFTATFGEDFPIAWDMERGEPVSGYLLPAVRYFFGNGGRRCWIIRVDDPIDSDGSGGFSANLFLDHDLKDVNSGQLVALADYLRYQSPAPRKLKGIYAALEIEEATMIAVPDAIHLGWRFMQHTPPPVPVEEHPVATPPYGDFSDCQPEKGNDPVPEIKSGLPSEKSVPLESMARWQQNSVKKYSSRSLLMIHRALITMCAARGDMTAVLSLPAHFRETASLRHVKKLRNYSTTGRNELSYASLYHPWQTSRDDRGHSRFVTAPPDGTICGMMAHRALSRGAWVAPANELFKNVVALAPPISNDVQGLLQEAQINVIRQEPRGFITLSADTLSDDRELRPLNVRRLLILIRKLALKKGAEYVFEPNDASFRRMVQRGFESMLGEMFKRGAFSGATPAMSYQVDTGSSLNTPQSVEQGRFFVDLKVSPSKPMSFLTIRLVQTGDRMSIAEGA